MSKNTMNNQTSGGGCEGSGVFDAMGDSASAMPGFSMPGFPMPGFPIAGNGDPRRTSAENASEIGGEAELRRQMRARLNAYFDAEGNRDRVASREALHDLSRTPGGTDELAAMRRVLSGFDVRPEHPDLTRVVLAKVAKRGTFLSRPARRRVSAARVLIACSLLVVVGAFVYIDRASTPQPDGPAGAISAVVDAQRSDAAESVRNLAIAVDALRSDLIEPVGALTATDPKQRLAAREPARALSMGDTSDYEESFRDPAGSARTPGSHDGARVAAYANTESADQTPGAMPMARLFAPIRTELGRTELGSRTDSPSLAAAANASAAARALASAQDAWMIRPSPSVLIGDIPDLHDAAGANAMADAEVAELARRLTIDLNSLSSSGSTSMAPEFIDDALLRGGLLTSSSPKVHEPEIRLRPDGTRTILWWVFPNASAETSK